MHHVHTCSQPAKAACVQCCGSILSLYRGMGWQLFCRLLDLKLDKSGYNKPVCASLLPGRQNNDRVTHPIHRHDYITCRVCCTTWKLVCASILLKHKTEQAQGNQFCAWDRPVTSTRIVCGTSCETCMPMSQDTSSKSLSGVWIDTASLE